MTVIAEKLDALPETIRSARSADIEEIAAALRSGLGRIVHAVGSGGSAVAAEYLALCRRTLQAPPTLVQTPLQFVMEDGDLTQSEVWLFSAGGSNPDILAAFDAARARNAQHIRILSTMSASPLADRAAAAKRAWLYLAPTAGEKDGFLATHSLVSMFTVLLLASDLCATNPVGPQIGESFAAEASCHLTHEMRDTVAARLSSVARDNTLFLLQDPRLNPASLLIETCAWEAGLCAVQRTDFRNFAHGRHVWLAHRGDASFILALTGQETRAIWKGLQTALPTGLRTDTLDFGSCGRAASALSLIHGLTVVEALGRATGIDPGRPGAGDFAEALYDAPSLLEMSYRLPPTIRSKRAAIRLRDDPAYRDVELEAAARAFRSRLAASRFTGLVLDYDGTLVTLEGRYEPMRADLAQELERLLDGGIHLAVATGRGGSAGERLREVVPERHHPDVLVSYYNGAYTRSLAVDIEQDPPLADPRIEVARSWLEASGMFKREPEFRNSTVQLTVNIADLSDPELLIRRFAAEANPDRCLRIARSFHTVDICLVEACKTTAAHALAERSGASLDSVLCIGDSGAFAGNDHALLGLPRGISVGRVCDRPEGAWSLFGASREGPDALLIILRALRYDGIGSYRLFVDELDELVRPCWTNSKTNPERRTT
jgi:hypothetical protein